MRAKVAKALRSRAREQTVGNPDRAYTRGSHNEIKLAQGCTRWVIQKTKKRRSQIIRNGEAPWQRTG